VAVTGSLQGLGGRRVMASINQASSNPAHSSAMLNRLDSTAGATSF
jgi:hypothetical protein